MFSGGPCPYSYGATSKQGEEQTPLGSVGAKTALSHSLRAALRSGLTLPIWPWLQYWNPVCFSYLINKTLTPTGLSEELNKLVWKATYQRRSSTHQPLFVHFLPTHTPKYSQLPATEDSIKGSFLSSSNYLFCPSLLSKWPILTLPENLIPTMGVTSLFLCCILPLIITTYICLAWMVWMFASPQNSYVET